MITIFNFYVTFVIKMSSVYLKKNEIFISKNNFYIALNVKVLFF